MKRSLNTVLALAVLAISVGCGGAAKYPKYYTLNLPPPPDPPAAAGVRASVAVRQFRSPVYLRQGAVVYKTSPEQIGFYEYHRWAVDPRDFVTDAVIDHLRASGDYARVEPYNGHSDIDYLLTGRLEKLEEIDYDGGVKVEVAVSAQMVNSATGATVWTNAVSEVGTVGRHDVPAVVSAMNQAMGRAIEKLLTPTPVPVAANKRPE